MANNAYFRLARIDGVCLPVELEYGDARCVVTDGDLVLRRDRILDGGDGIICIRLFGTALGLAEIHQIALEREPFDRLDETHLTFPGGFRHRQQIPPHSVIRYTDDGIEVADFTFDPTRCRAQRTFLPHRWTFASSQDRLPDSDAPAG